MNRDEILQKAQTEGKGKDYADLEAQQKGTYLAYFTGIVMILLIAAVEGFLFGRFSYGTFVPIFAMAFVAFLTKYRIRRKRHELYVSLCYGGGAVLWLILWILQLCGVIA